MSYSNSVLRAHGTKVSFQGEDAIEDCTLIGFRGEEYDLIEKTSLGAARKEWDASDTPDSPELTIRFPLTDFGTAFASGAVIDIKIEHPEFSQHFNAMILKDNPQPAEVGGLLYREITVKPLADYVPTP